jgi:hypothetical protein
MTQPRFLNDGEVNSLVELSRHDADARGDLAGYLHHTELISRLSQGEPGPGESEKYLEDFRAKYRRVS